MTQPRFSRRIFIVDKEFQLKFSFYVVSWIFALSAIYPLVIYNLYDALLSFASADPYGPSTSHLQENRTEVIQILVLIQLLFSGVVFIISIFMSHRIAGPLYKLRLFLKKTRDGDLSSTLSFRRHDHFKDLAEDYNSMVDGLRGIYRHQIYSAQAAIERIESALPETSPEGRRALEEALLALQEITERVQTPDESIQPKS